MKLVFALVLLVLSLFNGACAQFTSTDSGNAIRFDGVDDFIDFGDVYSDLKIPFTISAWINLGPNAQSAPVFTNRNCDPIYTGFRLIVSSTVISMDYGDGVGGNNPAFRKGKNATVSIRPGKWSHVTAVVNGPSSIELYLNGVNVGGTYTGNSALTMDSSKPGFASSGYFISNGVVYRYQGLIDEMRLWNRALSETEIRQTMCVKLAGNEVGLIGYWNFDEANGNKVFDKSSRHIDGVFRSNPIRERSGAPIGDLSTFSYKSNWLSQVLSLQANNNTVTVSGVSPSTQGVHIYAVKSTPVNITGINAPNIPDTYFGVFLAHQESSSTFSAEISSDDASCISRFYRNDNTSASWVSANTPLQKVAERAEIILVAAPDKTLSLNLGPDKLLCDAKEAQISTTVTDPDYSFLWNDGSVSSAIIVSKSGSYSVAMKGPCTIQKDTIHIEFIDAPPPFSLGPNIETCDPKEIILRIPKVQSSTISWQNGSDSLAMQVRQHGTYYASVKNACGEASDTIVISRPNLSELLPNVITPDFNGMNEFFTIPQEYGNPLALTIYNRWGRVVYNDKHYKNDWAGDGLSPGIYFFSLQSQCISNVRGTLTILKGNP